MSSKTLGLKIIGAVCCERCGAVIGMRCRNPSTGRTNFNLGSVCVVRWKAYKRYLAIVEERSHGPRSEIKQSDVVGGVIDRNPVDRKAFDVTRAGPQAWPTPGTSAEWRGRTAPKLRQIPPDMPNLIGVKCGQLTVVGLSLHSGKSGHGRATAWVCRCSCGYYVLRKTRAVRNPKNSKDACAPCRWVADANRVQYKRDVFAHTGQWPPDFTEER